MLRMMCKAKLHRVTVTDTNLNYAGSIGIDKALLEAAGIMEWEMVQVMNLNNGERFSTYCIPEPKDSGRICFYGPAAKKGKIGDLVIVLCAGFFSEEEVKNFKARVIYADSKNKIIKK